MSNEAKVNAIMVHIYVFIVHASILSSYSYYSTCTHFYAQCNYRYRTCFVENSQQIGMELHIKS